MCTQRDHMKRLVLTLLIAGFVAPVAASDYDNRANEPGYGQGCNIPTPSPKNTPKSSPAPTPRASDDKK